jgi:PPM family protein phosphatase
MDTTGGVAYAERTRGEREGQVVTTFTIRAAGQTRQGLRTANEDRFAIDDDRPVLVVADGLGGPGNGERAAELAVELLPHHILAELDHGQPEPAIQRALGETNEAVRVLSYESGPSRCSAATVVAFRHADQVFISWLGDCRAYRLSGGVTERLTEDHDARNALIRTGRLTAEEAVRASIRHVLVRFLGAPVLTEPFELRSFRPRPGDRLILATDGLWAFEENNLVTACRTYPDPQECADHLVEEALRHGSRDNVTCVVAAFDPVCVDAEWLTRNGGTVANLVRAIEEEKAFHLMPVLADALEDAGCTDAAILGHCRGPGPHAHGCWVVDLLLGKS